MARRVTKGGENSMRATHPILAREFHPTKNGEWTPDNIMAGTNKRLHWKCKTCSHKWLATGNNRVTKGKGCPYCSGHVVHIDGRNSMRSTHPELVSEMHPTKNPNINPDKIKAGTYRKIVWLCGTCSHEWMGAATIRSKNKAGCPVCAGQAVHIDGRNSMRKTHRKLATEFHPTKNGDLTPDNLIAGTNKKLYWVCSTCSHEWKTLGGARVKGSGCPTCAGKTVHADGRNSMRKTHRKLATEFHPTKNGDLTPDNLIAGTHKKLYWFCSKCSHEWRTAGSNRVMGKGCSACLGKALHTDRRNSMRNTHPELAKEFHPRKNGNSTPDTLLAGTHKRLHWICSTCSHEWKAQAISRKSSGRGCPACAGQVIHIDGRNSMRNTHPELTNEFHPTKNGNLTPDNLIAGTSKKLHWKCSTCSNEWRTTGNNRASSGTGCPLCLKKNQTKLFEIISTIYPEHEIIYDFKHPDLRFSQSRRKMELDIWIPQLSLAIEYQGQQHFDEFWQGFFQKSDSSLIAINERDEEKRLACKENNITLIEIKYTWDSSVEFVLEILRKNGFNP